MTSAHAGERPGGLRQLPVLRQIIDAWLMFHNSRVMTVFRRWRHGRPFWAGVFTALGAAELMYIPSAKLTLVIHEGIAGVSAYLMGILLVVMAATMWFAPAYRVFAGIATMLFAVASLVLSNLGGFLLGMLLGIVGGALSISWTPTRPAKAPADPPPAGAAADADTADPHDTIEPAAPADVTDTAVIEPVSEPIAEPGQDSGQGPHPAGQLPDDASRQRADLA